MTARALIVVLMLAWMAPASAVEPGEVLDDPALEARARALSQELRCLVCQNQSIDDSNAELARDLRVIVRERLVAGDSDEEVLAFVTARYGDFVLLNPPVKPATYVLWFAPAALLLVAGLWIARRGARRKGHTIASELTAEEERRLNELLGRDDAPEERAKR